MVEQGVGGIVVGVDVAAAAGVAIVCRSRSLRRERCVLAEALEEAGVQTIVDCNRQQMPGHEAACLEQPSSYNLAELAEVGVDLEVMGAAGE